MKTTQWRDIEKLFHAALERPPEERTAFLRSACPDGSLCEEVEALLSSDASHDDAVEMIPGWMAASLADEGFGQKPIGETIGRYRVISSLGSGGMGEVYLAQDGTLNRKVALKLLPSQFTRDRDRLQRFTQEARTASALNHPNIITIYEIGKWEQAEFIAMEFIEGETLRDRMRRGRLSLTEILEIGTQIAGALATAHAAGIVHRDIKPANIMVRSDGYIKVLDFGLAKLAAPPTGSATVDRTDPGRVMGTVSYMSPEQALGQPLDPRTDIFSLGVVLYELAAGVRPFEGKSDAAIYDALLNKTPARLIDSNPIAPAELDRIVRRALEKDRAIRYQNAAELRADLKHLERETGTGTAQTSGTAWPSTGKVRSQSKKLLLVAGLAAVAIMAAFAFRWQLARPAASFHKPVPVNFVRLTEGRGPEQFPSIAPDGKTFVYASAVSGNWDIYLQRVGGSNAINLTKDSVVDDTQPAFSPDGEYIAFRSERDGGGIFVIGSTGENTRRLTDFGYNPAWSPSGKEIAFGTEGVANPRVRFAPVSQLWIVNVATGVKRLITTKDAVQPSWSPHGLRIAYWGIPTGKRDIWTVAASGGEPVQVTRDATASGRSLQSHDWNPVWSPDGRYLYYASDRGGSMNLWRVAIDESTGKVLSEPEPVTIPAANVGHLSFSQDGHRMLYVHSDSKNNLEQIGFDPVTGRVNGQAVHVTEGSVQTSDPAISPDQSRIAFSTSGETQEDIFVSRSDGTDRHQLTNDIFKDRLPRWSPDGRRLAFMSNRSGAWEIWLIDADGSGLRQLTFASDYSVFPTWSPDGLRLAYSPGADNPRILQVDRPWAEQVPSKPKPPDEAREWFDPWSWSPDGRTLAGWRQSVRHSGGIAVYSTDTQKIETLSETGYFPVWLNDSSRLLFYNLGKLYLVDGQSKRISEVLSVAPYEIDRFDLSRDNRTICYSLTTREADIWMMTLQ